MSNIFSTRKLELTCPHCQKPNTVSVVDDALESSAVIADLECTRCRKRWDAQVPGPVVAGPFLKG